jgi:large subunit ribosomal protein L10
MAKVGLRRWRYLNQAFWLSGDSCPSQVVASLDAALFAKEGQEIYMALRLEDKQALVAEVNEVAANALSAIAADYRGMTVAQMTEFRVKAREEDVYVRVVKNTLAKRAIDGTEFECLADSLNGPIILAFSKNDPGAAARVVEEFSKNCEQLVAQAVAIGGAVYPASDIVRLAKLPTLEQARAQLLGLLQAPAGKFVRTIAEPQAKLVRLLAAYRDQQQAA